MLKVKCLVFVLTVFISPVGWAQSSVNYSSEPAEEKVAQQDEPKEKLSLSGYFDTYYFANLNKPSTRNSLGSSGVSRGFDRYTGQFQLGMFMARMNYSYKTAGFVAEVGWGPNMEYGSYGSDFRYRWGTVIANNTYSAVMLKQAYFTVKATDNLSVMAGQFGTHIGYEYIDSPLNFHYSINNTFNAGIPFYHLGLKATYTFTDNIALMAGIVNGTDNINDNNRGKSFIGQFSITPAKGVSIYLNTIQGNEGNSRDTGNDTTSYFGILDLVTSWQVNDNFMLGLWLMHGSAKGEFQGGSYFDRTRHWQGATFYTTLKFSDALSLGTRIEYFDNREGARSLLTQGKGTYVNSYTLTASLSLVDGKLLLKPEIRMDDFKKEKGSVGEEVMQQFADSKGTYSKNNQTTVGMAAIFKF
jgi:hypothetical protein